MLNTADALKLILSETKQVGTESVALHNALHRVLAEDVVADTNLPPFDNSAMDGYAVRAQDTRKATKRRGVVLSVVGEASAGKVYGTLLHKGQAVRIMTGGKIPAGADAVVPVEDVSSDGDAITLYGAVRKGNHIRKSGDDVCKGETVLWAGEVLNPLRLGLLASLGLGKVCVSRKPRVAILATGDELARGRSPLKEGQIRNSNSVMIAGYVSECGGEPWLRGAVRDDKARLLEKIKTSLNCDVFLITGGVSVGKYDYVKDALVEAGVRVKFWRANIKPGKPIVFGTYNTTLVFGLPGNPASTGVTFLQFVKPALEKMSGRLPQPPLVDSALCDEELSKNDGKRHFVRGYAYLKDGRLRVRKSGGQSSGALSAMARANCLIVLLEKTTRVKRGSKVPIQLL